MDLLVLAGGLGSRFGGLKQAEAIDSNGNFIIDYSIYDALSCGFNKVVVIVKPGTENIFKNTILNRAKGKNIVIVPQTFDNSILKKFDIDRHKPLGTAHAVLCAKNYISDNFCIINADDFYGKNSFKIASQYLTNLDKDCYNFALVGFVLKNTLSKNGLVKRGICFDKNGFVDKILESEVGFENGNFVARQIKTHKNVNATLNSVVSMNMFCLTPKIFDFLDAEFAGFCNDKQKLQNSEFLIPQVISNMVSQNIATLKLLATDEKWFGITYKSDKQTVAYKIKNLIKLGKYPNNLWKN